ncbi:MAG: response regulator transcription factor [Chloroflexi bacterium]|nr:response regulator transcription factor [Chloroflexota bacterium]MCC6897008.1 response regulator transcription factor [Anaerolineae bacterium]
MTHIMAVDDDPEVLDTLGRVLEREAYDVSLAKSAAEALELLERRVPSALILDIMMPGMDGITLCRQLRRDPRFSALPILFLTAKGSTEDVVDGLDAGADDYVVKPFELAELRARIHALLRRSVRDGSSGAVLQVNDLKLDSDTYQVTIKGTRIQLTSTEHRLLRYLMENPNRALSPSHLLQVVWEYPPNTGDPDLVRAHVRNLRSKIEKNSDRRYIRTIHGVGYMISI